MKGVCDTRRMTGNRWIQKLQESPGHSEWYVERFRRMAAEGADLHGEARLVDALVGRHARVLDAGCGPGRVGGHLAELGHESGGMLAMDMMEVDPVLDHQNQTARLGVELIVSAFGKSIL